jgi:protein-tyrosine kinase
MAREPDHLVERLAARLGGVGGLGSSPDGAPDARGPDHAPVPPPPQVDAELQAPEPADAMDDLPPPPPLEGDHAPEIQAAENRAQRQPGAGALVLERPVRQQRPRSEDLPAAPGVNLDTMVPAPLTLDLVTLERAGMVVGRKARTRISEEFRVTVGQILRSVRGSYTPGRGAGNLVMVTSARPGEGKSFSSLNIAGSIAQHTQREVLLVDIDAKQNALSDQLGIGDRPGLIDLALTPNLRIEDTIVRTIIPNLSFLPVGVRRVDSLEGGAEGTVARPITALIERLGRRFANHIVLLDAPPCLSTSDPSTLAPFVGQVVMVVEAERTQRSEVLAALDLIKACPTITLMLNKIRVTTSYTFGAYHYFGSYS